MRFFIGPNEKNILNFDDYNPLNFQWDLKQKYSI